MTSTTSTTVSEQSTASTATPSVLAGVSKPPAKRTSRKPAPKPAASKSAAPATERTVSQRKVSVMNAMIHASADLVRTDAAFKSAQRKYADLRDVTRSEAATLLAARLSYAPGDEWDSALPAPTVLQAGKRSKIAKTAAAERVTRPARKSTKSAKPTPKSMPAKRATRAAKPAA